MRLSSPLCLILFLVAGCASNERQPDATDSSAPIVEKRSETLSEQEKNAEAALRERLAEQSLELARLRLQLLAKGAEINRLLSSHEKLLQEAMRANARLHGLDSKAEAVAKIAEAALTIGNAKTAASGTQQQELIQAEKLLESARAELQAGDPDAAAYLAGKAISVVQTPLPSADQRSVIRADSEEAEFAVPLSMAVNSPSNVREQPGMESPISFQLAAGSRVKALGYKRLGIRIVADEEREGWIYHSLLETVAVDDSRE